MGTFWKSNSEVVNHITKKLLELLDSLPSDSEDPSFRHARQQICTSFVRLAKTADALPHINEIYGKISNLQGQGPLVWTEWSILAEAVLVMASAARVEEQHVVLEFFLQHLREQWTNPDSVKAYLSSHTGLVKLCSDPSNMWSVFHMVTFFGKALKSCGLRKRNISSQSTPAADATIVHPMALHLSWMLPTLLKLLRAIHSLWSPLITQALPAKIRAAIEMSDVERTSLLSEGNLKVSKNYSEANETDIRSWLKGIRDRGYNVLGLLTTVGDSFFKCVDSGSIALALMENIESMEFRHMRQLIRSVLIPLVKNCPSDLWDVWLKKLLRPLFVYSQLALAGSSSSQLRDLTRGICSLLSAAASPGVNTGLPRLKHPRLINSMDISSPERFDSFTSSSLVGYILGSEELFNPVSMIMTGAFNWTDGGAVTEILSFCDAAIRLAIFSDYVKLEQFISDKLFLTILHGLTLESNAMISGDLVGLCHKILVYLSGRNSSPQKILSSLLYITPELLAAFEKEMTKTYSSRKQKHLRGLLISATGKFLKALASRKEYVSSQTGQHE